MENSQHTSRAPVADSAFVPVLAEWVGDLVKPLSTLTMAVLRAAAYRRLWGQEPGSGPVEAPTDPSG